MMTTPALMDGLPPLATARAAAHRNLPSHAASQWANGTPVFTVDARKLMILGTRGHCWQCGHAISPPYCSISTAQDSQLANALANLFSVDGQLHTQTFGPMHRTCALYAATACPFLRYDKSVRRLTNHDARDRARGTASIHAFGRYAITFPPGPIPTSRFAYWDHAEEIPLTNTARIAQLHHQALSPDSADLHTPALRWTDSPDDQHRLARDWTTTQHQLQAWSHTTTTISNRQYKGHELTCHERHATAPANTEPAPTSSPPRSTATTANPNTGADRAPDHQPSPAPQPGRNYDAEYSNATTTNANSATTAAPDTQPKSTTASTPQQAAPNSTPTTAPQPAPHATPAKPAPKAQQHDVTSAHNDHNHCTQGYSDDTTTVR